MQIDIGERIAEKQDGFSLNIEGPPRASPQNSQTYIFAHRETGG